MLEVDKTTFEAEVLQAPGKVVVDFYGDGCVPCAALMPHVHEFAEKAQLSSSAPSTPLKPAVWPSARRYLACPLSQYTKTAK